MDTAETDSEAGVLYIASGDEYVKAAMKSARRINTCTDVDICLVSKTDSPPPVFDYVIAPNNMDYSFRDKVEHIRKTPFKKTVFLDADTWLVAEAGITDLFDVLDYVDLAATFDNHRVSSNPNFDPPDLPESLPMLSTGVLAFKDTTAVIELFKNWAENYDSYEMDSPPDQPAFRDAIASSDVRYSVLPREYNFILPSPQVVSSEVKLLHGDAANYKEIAQKINNTTWDTPRSYRPLYTSSPPPPGDRRIIPRLGRANKPGALRLSAQSIKEVGVGWTLACWAAGGPAVGRSRLEVLRKTIKEKGWTDAIRKVGKHIVK